MFKRIGLFVLTNILVLTAVTIILNIFGIGGYITATGLDYRSLMYFCLIWGMAGSLFSLALSRVMAKWMMGVKVIDPKGHSQYQWLVDMVHKVSRDAKLPAMPEVGIYQSDDINAFATGPTKSRSLVAVSTGILNFMNQEELEGVIAHEIAHIKNGDMITMTLIQGVINAFVMFFARIAAFAVTQAMRGNSEDESPAAGGLVYHLIVIVFQILFGFLGMMVVGWFSRQREFRADSGSGKLVGKDKMIAALEALKRIPGRIIPEPENNRGQEAFASLKISNNAPKKKFLELFSTHPPLEKRIAALQA